MDISGGLTSFVEAAEKLGRHKGNALLLYSLSRVKYPTVVRHLVSQFAALPPQFTADQFKMACHASIHHAASINETETLQREMLIYDDQRQGCHTGLARMMEKLG